MHDLCPWQSVYLGSATSELLQHLCRRVLCLFIDSRSSLTDGLSTRISECHVVLNQTSREGNWDTDQLIDHSGGCNQISAHPEVRTSIAIWWLLQALFDTSTSFEIPSFTVSRSKLQGIVSVTVTLKFGPSILVTEDYPLKCHLSQYCLFPLRTTAGLTYSGRINWWSSWHKLREIEMHCLKIWICVSVYGIADVEWLKFIWWLFCSSHPESNLDGTLVFPSFLTSATIDGFL